MSYAIKDDIYNIKDERCSNCEYNEYKNKCFICGNHDSEMYGLETEYNFSCELWEERNK